MESFREIVKLRMVLNHVENIKELSHLTGIKYQTLRSKIKRPEQLRLFELTAIDNVLHFENGEILQLTRG